MRRGVILALVLLALCEAVYAQGSVAILVSDNPADHAAATVWAEKIGASLVVTPWGSLSADAVGEVLSSGADIVYVVGGAVAVPEAEAELGRYGLSVIRVGGADRMETSLEVGKRFSVRRAVALDGYDRAGLEDAVTIGRAEGIPVVFVGRADTLAGEKLKGAGFDEVTLISNPALDEAVKGSIADAGLSLTEPSRSMAKAAQDMIGLAEERINGTAGLVRTVKDGPSLAAAGLLVDSKIMLARAKEALDGGNYRDAFVYAAASDEYALYAMSIYEGRYPGRIVDMVAEANEELSALGVEGAKDRLREKGAPYGVGLPVPPAIDLESYMVDVPGYTKSQVGAGIEYDMSARYTKRIGQTVIVEIYRRADEADARAWVDQIQFSPGVESRGWNSTTFMGYPASVKSVTYTASDNLNEEIFLRVAVGNLGVFSKFTQSVRKSDADLLLHPEVARAMVDEVTAAVVKAIEESQ